MTSIIKVDNLQNQCGANIISESSNVITIGASGDTVTLAAGASQSGFGRLGSVNWDTTPKTTGFTAVSGNGYFCNTTSAAFTVTLPAGPSAGAIVAVADYNGTAGTNNITVGRNSSNINGSATDFKISINYASISFVYVDATAGWRSVDTSDTLSVQNQFISATGGTITTSGNFKIHTFTGPGTFTVNTTGPGSSTVDYLVVAGGAGGGARHGGGGGAGGYRTNFPSSCAGIPVTTTAYPITVGAGGTIGQFALPATFINGGQGNPSVFSTITSTGGGGGGTASGVSCGAVTLAGGSGGGGTHCGPSITAGNGNTPPVAPPQGNPGGAGMSGAPYDGGGGGGATAAGEGGSGTGNGGAGTANSISGSSTSYAGGGGGGAYSGPASGSGGVGGGGAGSPTSPGVVNGTVNTGGGGGGAGNASPSPTPGQVGAAGGSGIVVIRYKFQ